MFRLGGVVRFVAVSSMVPLMSLPSVSCRRMHLRPCAILFLRRGSLFGPLIPMSMVS
jgi:hypothetical protein